jgi:hypothetical protein
MPAIIRKTTGRNILSIGIIGIPFLASPHGTMAVLISPVRFISFSNTRFSS